MIVERWHEGKVPSPSLKESFFARDGNFLEGFETVGGKAGRDDGDVLDVLRGKVFERLVGIGV